jgi:hypothetical protein
MRVTPAGASSSTGPATSVTFAPASRAARATAKPILPELELVITRTGSIGSSVGPAVTTTRLPSSALGAKKAWIRSNSSSASSMRPRPVSPQACSPAAGPANSTPSPRRAAALRCVAGFDHISTFIAGASMSGQRRARHSVLSRSSARPCASLPMKSALAGATTISSRSRDSSICPMLSGTRGSHRSEYTAWPDSACKVIGAIKRAPASVITTRRSTPALTSSRASSADLYAATPPVTPSSTRLPPIPVIRTPAPYVENQVRF